MSTPGWPYRQLPEEETAHALVPLFEQGGRTLEVRRASLNRPEIRSKLIVMARSRIVARKKAPASASGRSAAVTKKKQPTAKRVAAPSVKGRPSGQHASKAESFAVRAGESRLPTKKPADKIRVRRTADGLFVISGVKETNLVNRFPEVEVQRAAGKPKHLSKDRISAMVRLMKIKVA